MKCASPIFTLTLAAAFLLLSACSDSDSNPGGTGEGQAYLKFTWRSSIAPNLFVYATPNRISEFIVLSGPFHGDQSIVGNPSLPDFFARGYYYPTAPGSYSAAYRFTAGFFLPIDVVVDYTIRLNNPNRNIYFEIALDPTAALDDHADAIRDQNGHSVALIRHANFERTDNLLSKGGEGGRGVADDGGVSVREETINVPGGSISVTYRMAFVESGIY